MSSYWLMLVQDYGLYWFNLLITSIVLFMLGLLFGRLAGKLVNIALTGVRFDRILGTVVRFTFKDFLSRFVEYAIGILAFAFALNELGALSFVLKLIVGIILVAVLAAIVLHLRDILVNRMARARIRQLVIGAKVTVKDIEGTIIELRTAKCLLRSHGDLYDVPYVALKAR